MDEFGRALPSSNHAAVASAARVEHIRYQQEGQERRGGYDGYGERDGAVPGNGGSQEGGRERAGRDASAPPNGDYTPRDPHYDTTSRWREERYTEHRSDGPRWRDDKYTDRQGDGPRWHTEGGYGQAAAAAGHEQARAPQRGNQRSQSSTPHPAPHAGAAPAPVPHVTDGSALLHRYLSASADEELLNRAWFDVQGYISVVVLGCGELHADPCAVVQFESPHQARGVLTEMKEGAPRSLVRALQAASADPSRQLWLAVYHPPRAVREAASRRVDHPVSSVTVPPPQGIGLAPTTPHRFTADSTLYQLDSNTGMFWDGSLGWYACPRARSVLYLHAATGQYAMFNGIDFLPFTPSAPTGAPPAVKLLPGTSGASSQPSNANGQPQQALACHGSGYIVQRKRGVLICAVSMPVAAVFAGLHACLSAALSAPLQRRAGCHAAPGTFILARWQCEESGENTERVREYSSPEEPQWLAAQQVMWGGVLLLLQAPSNQYQ